MENNKQRLGAQTYELPFFHLAQTTSIEGRVFDGETGSTLPFVTISFKGEPVGTTSDINGVYSLSTDLKVSRISVSFLGYQSQYY